MHSTRWRYLRVSKIKTNASDRWRNGVIIDGLRLLIQISCGLGKLRLIESPKKFHFLRWIFNFPSHLTSEHFSVTCFYSLFIKLSKTFISLTMTDRSTSSPTTLSYSYLFTNLTECQGGLLLTDVLVAIQTVVGRLCDDICLQNVNHNIVM